jgi:hypothetical protein
MHMNVSLVAALRALQLELVTKSDFWQSFETWLEDPDTGFDQILGKGNRTAKNQLENLASRAKRELLDSQWCRRFVSNPTVAQALESMRARAKDHETILGWLDALDRALNENNSAVESEMEDPHSTISFDLTKAPFAVLTRGEETDSNETQRNATQRNATQSNETLGNETQRTN